MKTRKILPITLIALMAITAGCGETNPSESVVSGDQPSDVVSGDQPSDVVSEGSVNPDQVVVIGNKEALQAEWFLGEGNRRIEISATPSWEDINDAIDDGSLVITSTNPDVVSVTRLMLMPHAAGQATIKVQYNGASDEVNVTVKAERTAIDIYGTVHAGTLADPLDNADAVKVSAAVGTDKSVEYYIKGEVTNWYHFPGENASYASWYLKPIGEEQAFECYKISKNNATPTVDDVYPGAVVIVKGKITTYSGQAETDTGEFIQLVSEESAAKPTMATHEVSASEAVTIGSKLSDGDSTFDKYVVTGYVVIASGNNYFLADTRDADASDSKKLFELYGYDVATIGLADGSVAEEIVKGSKIQFTCHIKNYHGQVENSLRESLVKVLEAGEVSTAIEVSVTEALEIGYALQGECEAGKSITLTSPDEYKFQGYVCSKGTWNDQYKNGDVYIAEDAAETRTSKQIQVFRIKDADLFNQIIVGCKIEVVSSLIRYIQKNADGSIKKDVIETVEGPKVSIVEMPVDVTGALAIGNELASGAVTEIVYAITGYIVDLGSWSTQYKNVDMKIAQAAGETDETKMLTVYRFADKDVYDTLAVGDKITVYSPITHYVKTEGDVVTKDIVETTAKSTVVKFVEVIDETNYGSVEAPLTVAQALAIASEQCAENDQISKQEVYVKGIIVSTVSVNGNYGWKDFDIKDSASSEQSLYIYQVNKTDGVAAPAENDTVVIKGFLKNYSGKLQIANKSSSYPAMVSNTRGTSSISVTENEHVTVTVKAGDNEVTSATNGTTITVTAVAATGYNLDSIKINGVPAEATNGVATFELAGNTVISTVASDASVTVETKTDDIIIKNFTGVPSSYTTDGTEYTYTAEGGASYAATAINSSGNVRGNKSGFANFSLRNTTTISGYYVSKIELTVTGGTLAVDTGRSVVYFGANVFAKGNQPESEQTTGVLSNSSTVLTWENTSTSASYFMLYALKTSGTCTCTSLKVTWTKA